jgi:hypothetical protein
VAQGEEAAPAGGGDPEIIRHDPYFLLRAATKMAKFDAPPKLNVPSLRSGAGESFPKHRTPPPPDFGAQKLATTKSGKFEKLTCRPFLKLKLPKIAQGGKLGKINLSPLFEAKTSRN